MKLTLSIAVAGIVLMMALPAAAHHSFAAEYDTAQKVTLKGTVTRFDWMNPHAHFYLDVKDPGGKVAICQENNIDLVHVNAPAQLP